MTLLKRYEIQKKIIKRFEKEINFCYTSQPVPFCHVPEKEVHLTIRGYAEPTDEDVFDILHEIGHIKTNLPGMKRCEEEFYATQWAIKEMKRYKFDIPLKRKREFQKYIWDWRETGLKLRAKNVPSKEELTLVW